MIDLNCIIIFWAAAPSLTAHTGFPRVELHESESCVCTSLKYLTKRVFQAVRRLNHRERKGEEIRHSSMDYSQWFDRELKAMNGYIHGWCAVGLLAIGVCAAQGQTTPPASQPSAPSQTPSAPQPAPQAVAPGANETVDEISLNLAVLDKKGRKVLDLQPGDVVVTDNDVPVKLNTFQLVKGEDQDDHARNDGFRSP